MSKRQEVTPLRERLAALVRFVTLTPQEQAMVAAILLSMLVGTVVAHCRREYRLQHPVLASPTPRRASKSTDDH